MYICVISDGGNIFSLGVWHRTAIFTSFWWWWLLFFPRAEIHKGQDHGRPTAAVHSASAGVYRTLHHYGDTRGGESMVKTVLVLKP